MGHIQGANRHEELPFPQRLDEYLAGDNPVRVMDACVDALALAARGLRHAVAAATGRPSDHPGARLTLDMYGSLDRLRSSRRLEQATQRHVELRGRLHKLRPAHNTSAHFRRDPLHPRREVCRALTLSCQPLALCGGELVAIAGRQFRAVNAKGRNFTQANREQVIAQLAERVAGYLQALAAADDQDEAGTPGGARAADLPTKVEALRGRRVRSEDLPAAWERRGQDQPSLTAPDRRAMKGGSGGGPAVGENVQTAVEATHNLSVACAVTHAPPDRAGRSPLAVEAQEVLGAPFAAVAEVGYSPGQGVKQCLQAGLTPSIARPITSANQQLGLFSTDDVPDEAATDTSCGPAGERLGCRFDTVELGRHMRASATSACRPCPLKAPCPRHHGGRRITRWVDEHWLAQREQRVHARPESMAQRKELVEQPFGPMKRGWDQGDCLRRGVAQVRAEFSLTVLAYNLRRVLTLVDIPRLLARPRLSRAECAARHS
jgi:transposase